MNQNQASVPALGSAIVEALGLPGNVSRLTLRLEAGKPPVVEVELQDVERSLAGLPAELKRFTLAPIDEGAADADASVAIPSGTSYVGLSGEERSRIMLAELVDELRSVRERLDRWDRAGLPTRRAE